MQRKIKFQLYYKIGITLLLTLGCSMQQRQSQKNISSSPHDISIMAYNVENLFDTIHDEETEDYAFLPIKKKSTASHKKQCEKIRSFRYKKECLELDWSPHTLDIKMRRLSEAILQVNEGRGPDILIMPEVENLRVLQKFNNKYLKAAKYKTIIHQEGPDKRGIDVSILTRLPKASKPILHRIPFQEKKPGDRQWMNRSRGILESHLLLPDGQKIAIFAVHFPSPRNPTYWRQQAILFMNYLKSRLPEDVLAIAAGDFNISRQEESNYRLYKKQIGKNWLVSHHIGCHQCKGTNYYHSMTQWSFLDAILFDKRLAAPSSNWFVSPESIQIPNKSIYQVNKWGAPARFNKAQQPVGVSDHWPVFAVLKNRKKENKKENNKSAVHLKKTNP